MRRFVCLPGECQASGVRTFPVNARYTVDEARFIHADPGARALMYEAQMGDRSDGLDDLTR